MCPTHLVYFTDLGEAGRDSEAVCGNEVVLGGQHTSIWGLVMSSHLLVKQ